MFMFKHLSKAEANRAEFFQRLLCSQILNRGVSAFCLLIRQQNVFKEKTVTVNRCRRYSSSEKRTLLNVGFRWG